jgi:hypothetical protein
MGQRRNIMNHNSAENQRIKEKLVNREVVYCVSNLVWELSKKAEEFEDYTEDLYSAFRGLPDFEEAAIGHGWEAFTDKFGVECWKDSADDTTWAGNAEDVCREFDIATNDYEPEIFEHWVVSDYLADKLEANGHRVLRDFFGMTIWCRPTTGQAILLDGVISQIAEDMEILEGQKNEWK